MKPSMVTNPGSFGRSWLRITAESWSEGATSRIGCPAVCTSGSTRSRRVPCSGSERMSFARGVCAHPPTPCARSTRSGGADACIHSQAPGRRACPVTITPVPALPRARAHPDLITVAQRHPPLSRLRQVPNIHVDHDPLRAVAAFHRREVRSTCTRRATASAWRSPADANASPGAPPDTVWRRPTNRPLQPHPPPRYRDRDDVALLEPDVIDVAVQPMAVPVDRLHHLRAPPRPRRSAAAHRDPHLQRRIGEPLGRRPHHPPTAALDRVDVAVRLPCAAPASPPLPRFAPRPLR